MEPLPVGRSSPMATVNGGKLWVLGGTSGTRLVKVYGIPGYVGGFSLPGDKRIRKATT